MAWRNANASVSLVNAVNAKWPNRSKVSDGTIGDAAHATRNSDHNPWVKIGSMGIVRARDITAAGIDAAWLAEQLRLAGRAGDSRLRNGGYIIFNRRITTPDFSGWKVYKGSNPHTKHVHVSFARDAAGFDRTDGWAFMGGAGGTNVGGSTGTPVSTDVRWIQERLAYWGFNPGGVDGINGPKTKEAVKAFQKAKGLAVDGIVGSKTRAALSANKPVVQQSNPDVKWIQDRLNYWGFNAGAADGINGPKTKAAVVAFQRAKGLAADGIVGAKTRAALSANKPAPAPAGRPVLRRGSKGQAVKDVQAKIRAGYPAYAKNLAVDGDFGPSTERIVKEFQRRSGLKADGIVGPATYRKLGM